MAGIESKVPLVDREKELEELKNHLNNALEGQGNLLFLIGEVGVGKTRLLSELIDYAKSKNVQILQGWSLYETLTPYEPFLEALRDAELDYLFSQESPPKVECVYLMDVNGLLVSKAEREETSLDSEIFTGMLSAVGHFVKESLSLLSGEEEKGELNTLGYQNYRILIEAGKNTSLAAILTGRETEFLINDMKELLSRVEQDYGDLLIDWDGDRNKVRIIRDNLKTLITSGKYDGIDYAKHDPKIKRNRLFDNVLLGIVRHTKATPSLLCIEDLQWSDPSTLALMHYIARNTRNSNLLMLCTYRPEDVTSSKDGKVHFLVEAMQLMNREGLYKKIELERFKETHIEEMLNSILGKTSFTDEFIKYLHKETEGNPFFIVELIRMMVEEKTIGKKDEIWTLMKDLKEANIPNKVHDVVVRRLDRLREDERKTLDYASVIGEEFTSTILADAMDINRVKLLEQLSTIEKKHKLIHTFGEKYKFDHAKIKEVLYNEIPVELRSEYHNIIAHHIEEHNKDRINNVIEDLAFHYYNSRKREKAASFLAKAAEKAKKDYSNEEAIRFYGQALEFESEPQKRISIFETLGDLYDLIGDYENSIKSYEEALKSTKELKKIAEIKAKIGSMHEKKGDYDECIKTCNDALDLIRGEGSKEEALTLQNMGFAYLRKGEFDEAIENFEKGLKIGALIEDKWGIGACLGYIGVVHFRNGEYDKALEFHNKSYKIRKEIGDERGIASSLNAIGNINCAKGEYEKALNCYQNSLNIYERIGDRWGVGVCQSNIGLVYSDRGEFHEALEQFEKSLEIFDKIHDQDDIALAHHNIGDTYRLMGNYEKAMDYLTKSLMITEKVGSQSGNAYNYGVMAETNLLKGDYERALDLCTQALKISTEIGEIRAISASNRTFGKIYKEQKNWKESNRYFKESIKTFKRIGMEKELGDTYFEFGLMWKEKGDFKKAEDNLNKAKIIYEKLKLEKHLKKVELEL